MTYFLGRLRSSLLSLVGLTLVVFILVRLTGSPVDLYLPTDASAEMRSELTRRLGLDQPLHVQFLVFAADLSRFNFGTSLWHNAPALDVVLEALPHTLALGAIVLAVAGALAVVVGSLAAFRPNGAFDRVVSALSLMGASIPDFWFALMGILLFAVTLHWLPTSGYGGPIYWVLPVLTLALRPFGMLVQVVRGSMIEALGAPYVRTARAKGAQERRVIFVHGLRNALLPIITVAGDLAAQLAGGVTVVEAVFGWPGIGKLMIDAILQRDFPVLQAGILAVACVIILVNIAIDLCYALIDPRIRLGR